ncbi:MAG: hypothetical protein P8X46_05205 [Nitrospirales bacterium]
MKTTRTQASHKVLRPDRKRPKGFGDIDDFKVRGDHSRLFPVGTYEMLNHVVSLFTLACIDDGHTGPMGILANSSCLLPGIKNQRDGTMKPLGVHA